VRLDRSSITQRTTVSPRATASWVGGHGTTVTAATGLYTQSPGYEKLSNSDYMLDLTHPEADRLSSERAWLTSVAVVQRLPRGFTLKAEGYLRRLDDLLLGRLEPEDERLVYGPDLGTVADLRNARLPVFARLDLRVTWRPRGPDGRWELYAEALNLLNRKNSSALDPRLEHDPTSDRPRVVEQPIGSIPLLPTIGVRFRF
jgi:hypothetical protein